ncbi:hypothetical protein E2P81_ATG00347 [Venturia nashicola]|nr:hypothetical protein E2P81_ATG00347 [Venturia nashicola]
MPSHQAVGLDAYDFAISAMLGSILDSNNESMPQTQQFDVLVYFEAVCYTPCWAQSHTRMHAIVKALAMLDPEASTLCRGHLHFSMCNVTNRVDLPLAGDLEVLDSPNRNHSDTCILRFHADIGFTPEALTIGFTKRPVPVTQHQQTAIGSGHTTGTLCADLPSSADEQETPPEPSTFILSSEGIRSFIQAPTIITDASW